MAKDGLPSPFSNLQCLHFWLNIKCNPTVTWNFHILFQFLVKIPRTVSIPKEGDMTKFNGLAVETRNGVVNTSSKKIQTLIY